MNQDLCSTNWQGSSYATKSEANLYTEMVRYTWYSTDNLWVERDLDTPGCCANESYPKYISLLRLEIRQNGTSNGDVKIDVWIWTEQESTSVKFWNIVWTVVLDSGIIMRDYPCDIQLQYTLLDVTWGDKDFKAHGTLAKYIYMPWMPCNQRPAAIVNIIIYFLLIASADY